MNYILGVMVTVLASSMADRGFIGGVMVSVLASSMADRGFDHRSDKADGYTIGISCFSTKHATLSSKCKLYTIWL